VDDLCRAENAVFLRVEPEVWEPATPDFTSINLPGFVATQQTIQPPRTVMVSLVESEEDLLAAMKSKTRYNIRLAERKDVVVKPSDDVAAFHHMMLTTGERDAFGIHSLAYYQKVYDLFAAEGKCTLLTATYEEKPLAGLMVFVQGQTAWYLYGASTTKERNRMPTYLLHWEATRWAKSRGCTQYDLWGVPDLPDDALEERIMDRSDGLWGVYRFKRGFGGEIRRTIGAWDKVYRPALYRLYQIYTRSRREASA
jgi:lipid II:glycine glycyltransferase (peptidoglycan interpeptide bridge formation enzyme)